MQNSQFSQLVEQFIAGVIPRFRGSIRIDKSFTAAEDLSLPGDTIFEHDVNMENHVLRIAGQAVFHGSVSNAVILALGHVDIRGESRNCHVFALDSLRIAQSESSVLMSCGDMAFDTDVLRTSAAAAGAITGEQASVYGGMLVAGSNISIRNACCLPDDPPLSLVCGNRALSLSAAQLEIAYINRLVRLRKHARNNQLADDTESHLAHIQSEIERYQAATETLRQQLEHPKAYSIRLPGRVDSGLLVEINGHAVTVDQHHSSVIFSIQNGDITIDNAPLPTVPDHIAYVEP